MTHERSRVLLAAGGGALGAAAAWCWPAPAPLVPAIAPALGIPCRLSRPAGIAITFDDGPHPEGTPAVLEALAEPARPGRSSWWRAGRALARARRPDRRRGPRDRAARQIHRLLLRRTTAALARDLQRALAVIADATGRTPTCYRPPYGVFSSGALSLVRELGLAPLLWSRWGRDWGRHETPELIARRATRRLAPGDVVPLHDADHYSAPGSWKRTAAALPSVLASVATNGFTFVAASQDV